VRSKISTRLFFALPSGVLFGAIGKNGPYAETLIWGLGTPNSEKKPSTAKARSSEI
jgi:hypothetical protein